MIFLLNLAIMAETEDFKMAVSKAQIRATHKYGKALYYRPTIMIKRELEEAIRQKAQSEGKSISTYIQDLLKKDLGLTD